MLASNRDDLVVQSVFDQVTNPILGKNPYQRSVRGEPLVLPGVGVHTDCVTSGHGPGVTSIFTSATGKITPMITDNANVGYYPNNGRHRKE